MDQTVPHAGSAAQRPGIDSASLLTVYLVLLLAIPSSLRLPALGSVGTLASIWAMALGIWWCWMHVHRTRPLPAVGRHPVRALMFTFLLSVVISYVAAMERPLPTVELSQSDIGLLRMITFAAVLLVAHDGITTLSRLTIVAHRWVWANSALAALGLAQFSTGRTFVDVISIPGFVNAQSFSAVTDRGGFIRPAGTAMNPLEYGLALTSAMPLALTFALRRGGNRWLKWLPVALIGAALLVSGSRSSLLGLAVGVAVLFPFWNRQLKMIMGAASVMALAAFAVAAPGLVSNMRYLFTNTSSDSSALSRSGSWDVASQFIAQAPFFGRGFGSYLPEYRILDNQYLLLAIEVGLFGLAVCLAMIICAVVCPIRGRKLATSEFDRSLGVALAASTAAAASLVLFFDAFSFPMSAGAPFLMMGLCGAYWRLVRENALPRNARGRGGDDLEPATGPAS